MCMTCGCVCSHTSILIVVCGCFFFIHTHVALIAAVIPTGVVIILIVFMLFVFFVIGLYIKRHRKFAGMSSTCLCVDLGLVNFGLTYISDKADVSTSDKKRFVINFNVEFNVF